MLAPGEPVYDHQSSIANLRGMTEDTNEYEDGVLDESPGTI